LKIDYWEKVWKGQAPDNLDKWLNENYGLIIEKLAKKAEETKKRLECYTE